MSAHITAAAMRSEISSILIRPAGAGDAEAIARVRVDSWRAFFERIGAELVIEQAFQWDGMDLVDAVCIWLAHTRGAHRQSPGHTAARNDFAVIHASLARAQGRGLRAISKRIKENKQ
jgi:hypothetical protein